MSGKVCEGEASGAAEAPRLPHTGGPGAPVRPGLPHYLVLFRRPRGAKPEALRAPRQGVWSVAFGWCPGPRRRTRLGRKGAVPFSPISPRVCVRLTSGSGQLATRLCAQASLSRRGATPSSRTGCVLRWALSAQGRASPGSGGPVATLEARLAGRHRAQGQRSHLPGLGLASPTGRSRAQPSGHVPRRPPPSTASVQGRGVEGAYPQILNAQRGPDRLLWVDQWASQNICQVP